MMGEQDNKKKKRKEGNKLKTTKNNSLILIQSRFPSLPLGRHPSKSVFTSRKFASSHMQMNQVQRLFNNYIWSTSAGNPHESHRHQVH